jgi:oligopeptidase B
MQNASTSNGENSRRERPDRRISLRRIIVATESFVTHLLNHESVPVTVAPVSPDLPPAAPRRPTTRRLHGEEVPDDFAWMRDVDDPALIEYLSAENDYTTAQTAHLADLRETLFTELSTALPEDDESAPWRQGSWVYVSRRHAGQQYTVHCRRPGNGGDEQVVLDENVLAEGHEYLALGVLEVSPDGRLLAYSVDHEGDEVFTLRVKDLETGQLLPDQLTGTYYTLAWSSDGGSFLYTTLDEAYRPDTVHHHVLGQGQDQDRVVWREEDRRFELTVEASRSGAVALISANSRDTAEVRWLPTDDLDADPVPVQPRRVGVDYVVEHAGDRLLVLTDDAGPDFRLVELPWPAAASAAPRELLAHVPGVRIDDVAAFRHHVVVTERAEGSVRLRILDREGSTLRLVEPGGAGETVRLGRNEEYDAAALRVVREGWVQPRVDLDHDLASGLEGVVHRQQVLGTPPESYRCDVVQAPAQDGTAVPLSIIRGADRAAGEGEPGPCLIYGYGSYEASLDPEFWPELRPLLDRGFVVAIAHIRGGGELGREWWLQGRLLSKTNTFSDFVDCARHLVAEGVTAPSLLVARGISAGGLLMGAVIHLAPELFAGVVAEVPFVDVVNTMLDETLPLTVTEWDEWGDPREPEHYAYLASYSPYENLPGPGRPALLVTASRHDPRVSVHEPAKWVAKMRAQADGPEAPLLLRTALGAAAHTGPAGRYDGWRHEAFLHAFVLDAVGAATPLPS